jgi:hypothetical protein
MTATLVFIILLCVAGIAWFSKDDWGRWK